MLHGAQVGHEFVPLFTGQVAADASCQAFQWRTAVIMIVAGVYIPWFWTTELLGDGDDPTVAEGLVDGWSGSLTRFIEDNVWFLSFFLGGIIVSAIVSQVWRPRDLEDDAAELEGALT